MKRASVCSAVFVCVFIFGALVACTSDPVLTTTQQPSEPVKSTPPKSSEVAPEQIARLFGIKNPAALRDVRALAEDGGPDDGGDAEAGDADADAGVVTPSYAQDVTEAFCVRYGQCCGVPAANWNLALCKATLHRGGGYQGILETISFGPGTSLDTFFAGVCLQGWASLNCTTVTSRFSLLMLNACFGAIEGSLTNGSACSVSSECVEGYCTGGVCTDFKTLGTSCSDDAECSRFGAVEWCQAGVCAARSSNGSACTNNQHCASGLCAYPVCGTSIPTTDPVWTCPGYTLANDGG